MGRLAEIKNRVRALRRETHTLVLACRDPRVPWYAKALVVVVVGYLLSPIDLVPDFIPVLGYLDDLLLVPLGIRLAIRMIPDEVMEDCRVRSENQTLDNTPKNWVAGVIVLLVWALLVALSIAWIRRAL